MAKKRVAHKTTLQIDHDDDATYTIFGCLRNLSTPGCDREEVDMTCLDDEIEQKEPSPIINVGDVAGTIFWDQVDATQLLLEALCFRPVDDALPVIVPMRVILPFSATAGEMTALSFDGWLKALGEVNYEVKTEVSRDLTIVVHTKPIQTSGTGASFGMP